MLGNAQEMPINDLAEPPEAVPIISSDVEMEEGN